MCLLLLVLVYKPFLYDAKCQDPTFTQFYASPLYLNPAFSGATEQYRISSIYRNQWAAFPGSLQTNIISFDYHLIQHSSGIGGYIINDRVGGIGLNNLTAAAQYSYYFQVSPKWFFRTGLQIGFSQRTSSFNQLTFGDQLLNGGGGSQELLDDQNSNFFDFSGGFLAYSDRFWIGISLFHLNEPNSNVAISPVRLPMRQSIHAGAKIPFDPSNPRIGWSPAMVYQRQNPFDQLDIGLNLFYNSILAGVWYRGIPVVESAEGQLNQDAIAVLFGVRQGNWQFGYSFDITISSLMGISGGSHELSVVF